MFKLPTDEEIIEELRQLRIIEDGDETAEHPDTQYTDYPPLGPLGEVESDDINQYLPVNFPVRELKDADGIIVGWMRQLFSGTYKRMVGGEWHQICPQCGEPNDGPHLNCEVEVDTITAPPNATLGDYVHFHQRAKAMGYPMAVMPVSK